MLIVTNKRMPLASVWLLGVALKIIHTGDVDFEDAGSLSLGRHKLHLKDCHQR